tara:strand:- start:9008 stop:9358 length:351 start_codon:yes stop_codon:yes gene_type:complete
MNKKEESKYSLIKLWYFFRKKSIKSRNIKKISSEYDNEDNLLQLSDNESDKTETEIINKKKFIERGRRASSLKSNNSDDIKLYDKRDNSLDIIRNKNDDYEVVMEYQRYANYRTKK